MLDLEIIKQKIQNNNQRERERERERQRERESGTILVEPPEIVAGARHFDHRLRHHAFSFFLLFRKSLISL